MLRVPSWSAHLVRRDELTSIVDSQCIDSMTLADPHHRVTPCHSSDLLDFRVATGIVTSGTFSDGLLVLIQDPGIPAGARSHRRCPWAVPWPGASDASSSLLRLGPFNFVLICSGYPPTLTVSHCGTRPPMRTWSERTQSRRARPASCRWPPETSLIRFGALHAFLSLARAAEIGKSRRKGTDRPRLLT
jgi:hypothetical protein